MNIKKIIKKFENGNVCVVGERGAGKDMLFANVIARRGLPYISNSRYAKKYGQDLNHHKLNFEKLNCGMNTFDDFIQDNIKYYEYPYDLGVDVYITDVGIYFPSQYCNELNKKYKQVPTFMALSRHLGECNVHINVQNLNRAWDKLREQSRTYITCLKCKVIEIFGHQIVIQRVRICEKYQSCVDNVPPLRLPLSMRIGKNKAIAMLYKLNYEISHGIIEEGTMIYINKSNYDTHVFREMLKKGEKNERTEQ
jgi:hypothetical protein